MRIANAASRGTESVSLSRRGFLRAGATAAGIAGLSLTGSSHAEAAPVRATSCIFLFLTGGPSQLDTWDPKPDAPSEIRGPFASTATSIAGIRISEHFPRVAQRAHRYTIVRSVHHTASPVHETGRQLLQTGRLGCGKIAHPHVGEVLSGLLGPRRAGVAPFVILPCSHSHGAIDHPGPAARYGSTAFGSHCLQARRLIEAGVRFILVNMFTTVIDQVTWDCHADRRFLPATLDDYRRSLCPTFDRTFSALIDDLNERGLLDSTLVIAAGEFGRTPRLNSKGGRDHWPGVWSVLFAGGGVRGGQVIGASDKYGAEPSRCPVRAEDVAATIYRVLGVDPASRLMDARGEKTALTDGRPILELFI
jgi:uncharacterized protein (DUF1501 family)